MPREEPVTRAVLPFSEPAGRCWDMVLTPDGSGARSGPCRPLRPYQSGVSAPVLGFGQRRRRDWSTVPDLTHYLWIGWLALAVVFVIIELVTLEFTFLMLAAGALIGGL